MSKRGLAMAAVILAVVVLAIGLVLQNQSAFSRNYVRSELSAHGITFTPVANLVPAQQRIPCLVANAGKPLTTGKQAECYAKNQIGVDLTLVDNGKTYFQDHYNGYLARVKAQAAQKASPNDPATLALVEQASQIQRNADDLLAGEATRGLLLTAYGFSVLGDRLAQAALACFVIAGLLLIGGVILFILPNRKRATSSPNRRSAGAS
jgi:hypothetical protein